MHKNPFKSVESMRRYTEFVSLASSDWAHERAFYIKLEIIVCVFCKLGDYETFAGDLNKWIS